MDALLFTSNGRYLGSTRIHTVPDAIIWNGSAYVRDETPPKNPIALRAGSPIYRQAGFTFTATTIETPVDTAKQMNEPICVGYATPNATAPKCCDRAGEYNGFGSDGPVTFTCPNHCGCHD